MWHYDMADNAQLASYITVILPLWLRNSDANTSPLLDPLSKTNSPGRKVFRSKQKEKHAALGWPAACIIQPSVVRRKGTRSPRVVAPGLYRDALKKLRNFGCYPNNRKVFPNSRLNVAKPATVQVKHFLHSVGQGVYTHEVCETMNQWNNECCKAVVPGRIFYLHWLRRSFSTLATGKQSSIALNCFIIQTFESIKRRHLFTLFYWQDQMYMQLSHFLLCNCTIRHLTVVEGFYK